MSEDGNHNLDPIDPSTTQQLYLDHKASQVMEKTVQGHRYRTNHFVRWCDEKGTHCRPFATHSPTRDRVAFNYDEHISPQHVVDFREPDRERPLVQFRVYVPLIATNIAVRPVR